MGNARRKSTHYSIYPHRTKPKGRTKKLATEKTAHETKPDTKKPHHTHGAPRPTWPSPRPPQRQHPGRFSGENLQRREGSSSSSSTKETVHYRACENAVLLVLLEYEVYDSLQERKTCGILSQSLPL